MFSITIVSHLCYLDFLSLKMTLSPENTGVQSSTLHRDTAAVPNHRRLQTTGCLDFGMSGHMACLGYCRVQMFSRNMMRGRFYRLTHSLKIVDGLSVTRDKGVRRDKGLILWRVTPLPDRVRQGCLSLPRYNKVCIDEQIILSLAAVQPGSVSRARQTLLAYRSLCLSRWSGAGL